MTSKDGPRAERINLVGLFILGLKVVIRAYIISTKSLCIIICTYLYVHIPAYLDVGAVPYTKNFLLYIKFLPLLFI